MGLFFIKSEEIAKLIDGAFLINKLKKKLIQKLELTPYFAVRKGIAVNRG